jgi:hypothetical protein
MLSAPGYKGAVNTAKIAATTYRMLYFKTYANLIQ